MFPLILIQNPYPFLLYSKKSQWCLEWADYLISGGCYTQRLRPVFKYVFVISPWSTASFHFLNTLTKYTPHLFSPLFFSPVFFIIFLLVTLQLLQKKEDTQTFDECVHAHAHLAHLFLEGRNIWWQRYSLFKGTHAMWLLEHVGYLITFTSPSPISPSSIMEAVSALIQLDID